MATKFQATVRPAIVDAMRTYDIPGFVVVAIGPHGSVERLTVGSDAAGNALSADSIFPIASIGKLAVALAVLRFVDAGKLNLDDSLVSHLPDAAAAQPGVTIRSLLTHTAGLPFNYDENLTPYASSLTWPIIAAASLNTPATMTPGQQVGYSELDYRLLAVILERTTGFAIGTALERIIFEPLGIEAYLGVEPPRAPATIKRPADQFSGTAIEPHNTPFHRGLSDPSDSMTATADATLKLVRAFQNHPTGFLRPETLAEATSNQVGDLGGGFIGYQEWTRCPWGLGPELRGTKSPCWAPDEAGADSFGHAGGSGCLGWAAASANIAWAIHGARWLSPWLLPAGPIIGAAIMEAFQ